MIDSESALQNLSNIPFFRECDKGSLARLLPNLAVEELEPGERLYAEGEFASHFFWVLSGRLDPASADRNSPWTTTDGYCGIEAALGLTAYQADMAARTQAAVLSIPGHTLLHFLDENPKLGTRFFSDLLPRAPASVKDSPLPVPSNPPSWTPNLGWAITLLLPVLMMLALPDWGFSANQTIFLAILTATVAMWVFHLVDMFIPSLFMVLAILVLGLAPQEVVLAGFASDSLFMAMSVLGLGTLIVVSGLSFRFLLWILKVTPNNQFFYHFNLILAGILLTPLLPSINARVALMTPILTDMVELLNTRRRSPVANGLTASMFAGVSLFSPIFMTGKSTNFIIYGLLPTQFQQQFGWVYWLVASLVVGVASLVLYALASAWYYRNQDRPKLSREVLAMQLRVLGPLSYAEWMAVGGILLFMLGVLSASIHHIDPAWLALTLLFALLLSGSLTPDTFRRKLDWPFLIFLGSTVGMAKTMGYLGLDTWLSSHLVWMGDYMNQSLEWFILLLTLTLFVIRLAVPITATIVITATLLLPLAETHGLNPWVVGFFILVLGENFYLPYQSSYYIQLYSLTERASLYQEGNFLRFNAGVTLIKILSLYITLPYWRWLGII